jgi:hypothetical protein
MSRSQTTSFISAWRGLVINDDVLLGWIRSCIEAGQYHFTDHAMTKHPRDEGFALRDAITAIQNGEIVSRRDEEARCLVCGHVPGLALSPDYVATYLHCSIQWDYGDGVVIITVYRPSSGEWINHRTRRRH